MRIHGQMYFGVESPLFGSSFDCRLVRPLRTDELYSGSRRSSATGNRAPRLKYSADFPSARYLAIAKNGGAYCSSRHNQQANFAKAHLCLKSKKQR